MNRPIPRTPALMLLGGAVASVALLAYAVRRRLAPRHENREERRGSRTAVPKPPSDGGAHHQRQESGFGDLIHREYFITIPCATFTPTSLMQEIQRRVGELSPAKLAKFRKTVGHPARMAKGDEYHITMMGPWNGRVRVAEVTDRAFTFVTLKGHPEAGHITFSVKRVADQSDMLMVTIESWARARDEAVYAGYDTIEAGREVQTEVWVTFLQRVAEIAGCKKAPEVQIESEEIST